MGEQEGTNSGTGRVLDGGGKPGTNFYTSSIRRWATCSSPPKQDQLANTPHVRITGTGDYSYDIYRFTRFDHCRRTCRRRRQPDVTGFQRVTDPATDLLDKVDLLFLRRDFRWTGAVTQNDGCGRWASPIATTR